MIRAVFVDFGGVIVRTEDREPRARAAEHAHMSVRALEKIIFESGTSVQASRGEISEQAHWQWVNAALGLPKEQADQVTTQFFAGDRRDDALLDFLRSLRPERRVGLISNAWSGLRALIEREGFAGVFDQMIISAEAGLMKPDPAIYHLALERLDVRPEESVFLDDMLANIEGARAIGMHGIQFVRADQALDELKRLINNHR